MTNAGIFVVILTEITMDNELSTKTFQPYVIFSQNIEEENAEGSFLALIDSLSPYMKSCPEVCQGVRVAQ